MVRIIIFGIDIDDAFAMEFDRIHLRKVKLHELFDVKLKVDNPAQQLFKASKLPEFGGAVVEPFSNLLIC